MKSRSAIFKFKATLSTMRRGAFRAAVCMMLQSLTLLSVNAEDVPWLDAVTQVPDGIPSPSRPLRNVLELANGTPLTTPEEWEKARGEIRTAWEKFLGPRPARSDSLGVKSLKLETLDGTTRELIEYQVEPGRNVRAYLLRPHPLPEGKLPGLVVFHSTLDHTIESEAGLGGPQDPNTGIELAARGFVVICPENFLWEESNRNEAVQAARRRNPDSLGMMTMLSDGQRALDLLESLPEVDTQRLGASGHSLGAKETLYLMAFDERVCAGVFSEGGIALDSTNWHAPWYLGSRVTEPDFPLDHQELIALIAPRPFLVLGGETLPESSDGNRSWPYIKVGQDVSRFLGVPVRQGMLNHGEGHEISRASKEKVYEWLECYVARKSP
ncbi:alpha/beta hydrolase family protein [Planctomicrobium sp. SH661]|uniref:alpha/beta hydrolase family protein n=1 Tax=Planctomicrobium sp. SH661 TaxID=3448124 RepID=UPI003F5C7E4F